jgi:hypothetical membrane protein
MRNLEKLSLGAAVAVPFLYYGNVVLSSLLYPGYSHILQYVSELGSAAAPHAWVFNTGVVLFGLATASSGAGLGLALYRRDSGRLLAVLVAVLVTLGGLGFVMGGLFPMPDPRHGGFGLALAMHLVPALLAWGLRRRPELRLLRLFLWLSFVAMLAALAIMMGVGELVTRANVGAFQRLYALTMFPWLGIAGWTLSRQPVERRLGAPPVAAVA